MSLTGSPLLVLVGVLAVLLPVLATVVWRQLGRRSAGAVTGRLGLVVISQLLAVSFVALLVNDSGYFYGSWSDLMGQTRTGHITQVTVSGTHHGVTPMTITPTWFGNFVSTPRAQWSRKGRVLPVRIGGATTGLQEKALIYEPPQYFQRRWAGHRFPGILALTGYPSTSRSITHALHYASALHRDVRRHAARPAVMVITTPNPVFPRDTECTDVPGGPQTLTYFSQDVPHEVAKLLRVRSDRWGVIGYSTGGYCAAKIAMTAPYQFPVAVSLSGYYTDYQRRVTGSLWGGAPGLRALNNLDWRVTHLPPPPISLLATVGTGERDAYGLSNTLKFASLVRPPMRLYTLEVQGGSHNFQTWGRELPSAFVWMSRRLGGSVSAGGTGPGRVTAAKARP
jgi:Putative esterase